MRTARPLAVVLAAVMPWLLVACPDNKEKDIPSAQPIISAAPSASSVNVAPEVPDAAADVSDASDAADGDGSDGKVVVGASNLTKCCNAIKQNQKSAPPDQQLLYGAAISLCNSGVIPPQFRNLPQCK